MKNPTGFPRPILQAGSLAVAALIAVSSTTESHSRMSGFISPELKWPGNPALINVCFDFNGYSTEKEEVKRGALQWQVYTHLDFRFFDKDNHLDNTGCSRSDAVRIRLLDVDGESPFTNGLGVETRQNRQAASQVGMYLNFSFQNFQPSFEGKRYKYNAADRMKWIRHYAIHEFGHVLGISHEQNRPDKEYAKERYGKVVESCLDDHAAGLVNSKAEMDVGTTTVGFFDPYSIMNYPCPVDEDFRPIPQMNLSCGDKAAVRELYGIKNASTDRQCVKACLNYARLDANLAKQSAATPEYAECEDALGLSGSEPPRPEELLFPEYQSTPGASTTSRLPMTGARFTIGDKSPVPVWYTMAEKAADIKVDVTDKAKNGIPGWDLTFTLLNAEDFNPQTNDNPYEPIIERVKMYEMTGSSPRGVVGNSDNLFYEKVDEKVIGRDLFYVKPAYTYWIPKGNPMHFNQESGHFVQKSKTPPFTNALFLQDLKTGDFLIDRNYYKIVVSWCEYAKKDNDILGPQCVSDEAMQSEIMLRNSPSFMSRRAATGNLIPQPASGGQAVNQPAEGQVARTRISWQAAVDTDPLYYTVYLSTTPNPLEGKAIYAAQATLADLSLSYKTKYYWQVLAYDGVFYSLSDAWSFETLQPPFTLLCPPETSKPLFEPHYGSYQPGDGDFVYHIRERSSNGLIMNRPSSVPIELWRPIDYPEGVCIETRNDDMVIELANIPAEVTRDHYIVVVAEDWVKFSIRHQAISNPGGTQTVDPGLSMPNPMWTTFGMANIVRLSDYWGNPGYTDWRTQDRPLALWVKTSCPDCQGAPTSVKISKIIFTKKNPFLFDFQGVAGSGTKFSDPSGMIPVARVEAGGKLALPLMFKAGLRNHTLSLDAGSITKGFSLDRNTNIVTWTPGENHLGMHVVTLTASSTSGSPAQTVTRKSAVEVVKLPRRPKKVPLSFLGLLLD